MSVTRPRPAPPTADDEALLGAPRLRLVRLRLGLALLAVAILPVAVILPVVRLASADGGQRQATTAAAVALAGQALSAVDGVTTALADAAGIDGFVDGKDNLAPAARTALATLAGDRRVSALVAADPGGHVLYAARPKDRLTADELEAALDATDGPIALPVDGSADEIGLAVTVRRNGNGKPLAVVVADVALAAVLPPSAVA
ncbi:MAG TPA: hypothetical protein VFS32_05095, partial [Candidatus Limnocylindrales bacterium]|nr:hypothetical protein [Candidatus Limnocylindrales bacterium]